MPTGDKKMIILILFIQKKEKMKMKQTWTCF